MGLSMETKYRTTENITEITKYMDSLVRYLFSKLKKDLPTKLDTVYYPAYYLYRSNIDEFNDMKHLDEGYRNITITLRKVTNDSTTIIVKLSDIDKTDWRYDMLVSVYRKVVSTIEKSITTYFRREDIIK